MVQQTPEVEPLPPLSAQTPGDEVTATADADLNAVFVPGPV
jgi:hypothetical protein